MPAHTVHSSLVEMYFDDPGAPWKFPQWQTITGIKAGLFTELDSQLPPGWDRKTVDCVRSYFDQYRKKKGQDQRVQFAAARKGSTEVPGRELWRKFITDLWKGRQVHSVITAVLTEEGLHPVQRALASRAGGIDKLPNSTDYLGDAVDPVGKAIFGFECLDKDGARVDMILRGSLRSLIYRTWLNIKNQVIRSRTRISQLEQDVTNAFDNLNKEEPTKANAKSVILKVAKWKALAHGLGLPDHIEKVQRIEDELQHIMITLGALLTEPSSKAKLIAFKFNDQMIKTLISEDDKAEVVNLYVDFFSAPTVEDSVPLDDQHATLGIQFGEKDGGHTDLGIEFEANLPPDILASNLGFSKRLPLLFNEYRHKAGFTPWQSEHEALFSPELAAKNPAMDPLCLYWHQIAGLHSIVRSNFSSEPERDTTLGCLVADEVGLGKTFLSAMVIAFLSDVVTRQSMMKGSVGGSVKLPPLLNEKPFLGEYKELPKRPHLILVPGTLLAQWKHGLEMVFKPRSFDILEYAAGKAQRDQFWAPEGPFHSSISGANLIILAPHSALQSDFASLFTWEKRRASWTGLPWDTATRMPNYDTTAPTTLYGQNYLSITFDEVQGFRNIGAKHSAALELMKLTIFRLIMTATPLQTSTKDAASMGRLLGIPYFLSEEAFQEEKDDASLLRQVRRAGEETDSCVPNAELKKCHIEIAQRMQTHFTNRILRRTGNSLDWRGEKLIDLPPYVNIPVIVKPTAREMEIISELADNVKDSVSSTNGVLQICSRSFYIDHRICVLYARRNLAEPVPHFETLAQWEEKKSTKFDICARLCRHLLTRDDAPEIEVVDGKVHFPAFPPLQPSEQPQTTAKLIISMELTCLGPLLRNVLDLYGIKNVYISGQLSYPQRAKVVSQFLLEPDCRVLIISSVGSIGLNLTQACIVIYVTQAWSSQDELQIRGRVHRPPQKKVVRCYHILADETADIILAALAHDKHHMMAGFLTQDRGKEMLTLLSGKNVADPQDDYDETDPAYMREGPSIVKAKSKKSKGKQNEEGGQQRKRGRNKSAAVVVDSDSEVPKDTPSVEAKKKGKKKARDEVAIDVDESAAVVVDSNPDVPKDTTGVKAKKKGKKKARDEVAIDVDESAAVVVDSNPDVPKDTTGVKAKKKGKKKARGEITIGVDKLPTILPHNPTAAASVSAPAPANTGSKPVDLPAPVSAHVPAATMALDSEDDASVTPTPASPAGPPNPSFAASPNEVQDILMGDVFGNLDDGLNSGYTESSSPLEDNAAYSPTTWPLDADNPFNLPTTPEKGEPSGRRVRSMSPDSPELSRTMKRPRANLADLMVYDSSPLSPLNDETTFGELVYPPSEGQTPHDAYNTSLHAKLSIVNDIPPSKTAPISDLGVPFSMQTSSQGPANPFPSSGPLPAFDRRRPQVPRANADTQPAKPRQTSLSNAFGLSANISASNPRPPGSMAPPPNTWEQSTPWHNVSVGPSSLKISNKQSMSNLSAPQPHQSHSSAAAKLKRPVSFPGNLHAPDQRTSSFRQPTPLSELPQSSSSLQAPKASTKSKNPFLRAQPKQKKKGV